MTAKTLERDTQGPDEPATNGVANILRYYNCRVVYATTYSEASAALAEILADAAASGRLIAVDIETMPISAALESLSDARRKKATAQGTARALTKLKAEHADIAAAKVEARRVASASVYAERQASTRVVRRSACSRSMRAEGMSWWLT